MSLLRRTKETFLRKGFATRTVESTLKHVGESEGELSKSLGPLDLTMLGIGSIVGAGVFVLTGEAAKEHAGPSVIISYVLSSVVAVLLALSYIEFAVDLPVTGGAFNYIRLIQGEFIAWQAGACLLVEYAIGIAAVSKGFSGYLASLFGLGTNTFVAEMWVFDIDILAFCLVTALTLLVYLGTKESASFNAVVTATNLALIGFILCAAVSKVDKDNYSPFMPRGSHEIFTAAAVVFFANIGFDGLASVAAEVKNPQRDLPISVFGSIGISAILYVLMGAALTGLQSYRDIDVTAPFSEAFVAVNMDWAGRIVALGAITGIITTALTACLGVSRVFIAIGREKLLPTWICAIDDKRSTPKHALMVTWIMSGMMSLLFDIGILSRLVSMGTIFVLVLVSISAIQRMYKAPDKTNEAWPVCIRLWILVSASIVEGASFASETHPAVYYIAMGVAAVTMFSFYLLPVNYIPQYFVTPLKPLTPCLAVFAGIHLMFSLGWEAHVLFIVWQLLSLLIYLFYGMHHTDEPDEATEEIQMQQTNDIPGNGLLSGIADRSDVPSTVN